jgi:hypothetical protein
MQGCIKDFAVRLKVKLGTGKDRSSVKIRSQVGVVFCEQIGSIRKVMIEHDHYNND